MSEIWYDYLEPLDWGSLVPIMGKNMPHPSTARIVVARRGQKIVGFLVVQAAFHAEPLWIAEEERGKVNWLRMLHLQEDDFLRYTHGGYYVFAPDEKIRGMCKAAGLQEKPWQVFWKDVS